MKAISGLVSVFVLIAAIGVAATAPKDEAAGLAALGGGDLARAGG